MSQGAQFYDLDVRGSAIIARDQSGAAAFRGTALVDAIIWLQQGRPPTASQYAVRIAAVSTVPELVAHAGKGGVMITSEIETYNLQWEMVQGSGLPGVVRAGDPLPVPPLFGGTEQVCPVWRRHSELSVYTGNPAVSVEGRPNPASDPAWDNSLSWDESTVIPPFNAVVFEGDRFDATTRTVQPTADDRWFNIGCARHTLSKLRLSRNTIHTTTNGWQQVQATLKMLSGDYCGTGTALTVAGTPIVWQQNPPGMAYRFTPSPDSIEARWNENGALCLNKPRLVLHPDPGFPDILGSIASECARTSEHLEHPLPTCNRTEMTPRGTRITTANLTELPAP